MENVRDASYEFEESLVISVIVNRAFRDYVMGGVAPDFFNDWYLGYVYSIVRKMRERDIGWVSLAEEVKADFTIEDQQVERILALIQRWRKVPQDLYESHLVRCRGRMESVVTERRVIAALKNAATAVKERQIDKALSALRNLDEKCKFSNIAPGSFWEMIENLDSPDRVDWKEGIPLGINGHVDGVRVTVDESLYQGGLGRGHICIVQASAKMGKSTLMANIGLYQALRGYRVLVYSLELDTDYIGHRLCQLLSETPSGEYQKADKREIKKLIKERLALYDSKGSLDWFHYPAQEISPSRIDMDLTVLGQKHKKPDVVIIDYLDLLRADSHFKEYRLQLGQITVGLRRLAKIHEVAVITATQSNRQARRLGSDSSTISEDYSKAMTCDLLIALNETSDPTNNGGISNYFLTIDLNRFGPAGIRIHLDQADKGIARFFNV